MQVLLIYNKIMNKYYAVKKGKSPGIYRTWNECKSQVDGYSGAEYKKFNTKDEAMDFINPKEKKPLTFSNPEDQLIAYVDGSYNNSNCSYSYGAVLIDSVGEIETFSKRFKKDKFSQHRNVIGEIYGAMFAMRYALEKGYKELYLHYDYEGIEKWAIGSWKRNKEATKMYHEFYNSIKNDLSVKFIKVKSHSGDKYNDLADKLAKEAVIKTP